MNIPASIEESLLLSQNDRGFLKRVYAEGLEKYGKRLERIGFHKKDHVLDAGCGFGQWSFALAETCNRVTGVDISTSRIDLCNLLAASNGIENVTFLEGKLESLPFPDLTFDGIFSYSVLYLTDYPQTLREFYRLLKPGGTLYFSTNGPGKYLHDILHNPNATADFSPRIYSLKTIRNSFAGIKTGLSPQNGGVIMSRKGTVVCLRSVGFTDIRTGGDGSLSIGKGEPDRRISFYPEKYWGFDNVFEVMARKPAKVA